MFCFTLGQLSQIPSCFGAGVTKLNEPPSSFLLPPHYCGLGAGSIPFRATVNKKQCETIGLFMSLVIHYWIGDVQDSQGVSAFEMTYIVLDGALNSTHSLTHYPGADHNSSLATVTSEMMRFSVRSRSVKYDSSSSAAVPPGCSSTAARRPYSSRSRSSGSTWAANWRRHGWRSVHIVARTFSRASWSGTTSRRGTSSHQPCSTTDSSSGTLR